MAQSKNKERRKERIKKWLKERALSKAHTRTVSFEWPLHVLFYNMMTEGLKKIKMYVYVCVCTRLHISSPKFEKKREKSSE